MDWTIFWSIVGVVATGVGLIYAFLRNFKADINTHIDRIDREWKEESKRMDQRVTEANRRMDGVYHILLKRTENQGL